MRRSLRKMDPQEAAQYLEEEQLFTVESLEEARQRLWAQGLDPATFCFFSWMRNGVRYYRVWEDKRIKEGIVRAVPVGQIAATLKRAVAEKLYIAARRYSGSLANMEARDGQIRVIDQGTGDLKALISLPIAGGAFIVEPGGQWNERQAAHFVNVILVRGQTVDVAFEEAEGLHS